MAIKSNHIVGRVIVSGQLKRKYANISSDLKSFLWDICNKNVISSIKYIKKSTQKYKFCILSLIL